MSNHYIIYVNEKQPDAATPKTNAFIVKLSRVAITCLLSSTLCGINILAFGITTEYLSTLSPWLVDAEVLLICALGYLIIWSIRQEGDISDTMANAFILVQGLYTGIIISKDTTYSILSGAMLMLLLLLGCMLAIQKYGVDIEKLCSFVNESTESVIAVIWLPFMLSFVGNCVKHLVLAAAVFYLFCNTMCMVLRKHTTEQHLKAGIDLYLHAAVKFVILQGAFFAFW
ncbi:hypothetical protein EV175_000531 [Coemansia sp. RSA 1933]|nr:hypothetical protein EV175_000531 [Coemansia sp. RSA 1933]